MSLNQLNFINYPVPKESRTSRKREPDGKNPVLSGLLLVIASTLLSASTLVQKLLWRLNKFDKIKDLPELEGYGARYDPTVVPLIHEEGEPLALLDLPKPRKRKHVQAHYTTADYHEAYLSGSLTPSDVAEILLPLITRQGKNPSRYAVAYLDVKPELVRAAARASTERYRAGKPLSMLDGVPVGIKDEIDVKGHTQSFGSGLDFKTDLDATGWCVQKWMDAGAIILGKCNMHEIGLDTCNNNPTWGTPLNPHNELYYTGGSSGGSGCTAAQGICPIALGVDGGGSIRIPSSFCGLYGLKTTQSRLSVYPTEPGTNTVAVAGPMSPNIDDLALSYRIMAQPCPQDPVSGMFPSSITRKAIELEAPAKRYLGIDREWVGRSDPVVLKMYDAAVQYYTQTLGFEVVDISIPLQAENEKAFSLTILAEGMTSLKPENIKKLQYPNQILLNVSALHATAQDLLSSNRLRERAMRHLAWLWEQYPGMLILTPTTPCAGWKIAKHSDITDGYGISDADMSLRTMEYTSFGNWVGCPAITCPVGYASGNVPVGIMALGQWGSEERLLEFGSMHQNFLGEEGVRRPTARDCWVDVLASARKS